MHRARRSPESLRPAHLAQALILGLALPAAASAEELATTVAALGAAELASPKAVATCNAPLQGDVCLVFSCAGCAGQTIFDGGRTFTVNVTDTALESQTGYSECTIHDVNVAVRYTHSRIGDTNVSVLRNGDQNILWTNNNCDATVLDALFDDDASNANSCPISSGGARDTNDSLASYNGDGFDAQWQLTINDFVSPGGTGTLDTFALAADVTCLNQPGPDCTSNSTTACLNQNRFKVTMTWRTPQGDSGVGRAVELTSDTAYFWFFDNDNVEVVVKVLDGCGVNNRFWVFASGLTNVEVVITVEDTLTGAVRTYTNPLGEPFQPVQHTGAFLCP
jgi:hypothetical protein